MIHGPAAISQDYLVPLELREGIETVAEDLYRYPTWSASEAAQERAQRRYPGW